MKPLASGRSLAPAGPNLDPTRAAQTAPSVEFALKRLTGSLFSRFRTSEQGAILVEALIAFPVVTLFAAGVLEFGYVFWERQQLQAGVRDAARYMARCNDEALAANVCSEATARQIAFNYFDARSGTVRQRINGWNSTDPNALVFTRTVTSVSQLSEGRFVDITVEGTLLHRESPLFVLLNLDGVPITYTYSMRYLGW